MRFTRFHFTQYFWFPKISVIQGLPVMELIESNIWLEGLICFYARTYIEGVNQTKLLYSKAVLFRSPHKAVIGMYKLCNTYIHSWYIYTYSNDFISRIKFSALKSSTWLCSGNAGENSFISIGDNTVDKKYNPLSELVFHIQLLTSLPWYIV